MRQGLLYFFNLFIRLEKGDKGLKISIYFKIKASKFTQIFIKNSSNFKLNLAQTFIKNLNSNQVKILKQI